MLGVFVSGLLMGLGLIAAIGAQNAFVLRQGIRREHIVPVVLICIASDAALIMAGYFGLGSFLSQTPQLIVVLKWLGRLTLSIWVFRRCAVFARASRSTSGLLGVRDGNRCASLRLPRCR